eukprot:364454-Chlamydomonas_euryale.AAC.2
MSWRLPLHPSHSCARLTPCFAQLFPFPRCAVHPPRRSHSIPLRAKLSHFAQDTLLAQPSPCATPSTGTTLQTWPSAQVGHASCGSARTASAFSSPFYDPDRPSRPRQSWPSAQPAPAVDVWPFVRAAAPALYPRYSALPTSQTIDHPHRQPPTPGRRVPPRPYTEQPG